MRPYYADLEEEFAEARALLHVWNDAQPHGFLIALEMSVRHLTGQLTALATLIDLDMRRRCVIT